MPTYDYECEKGHRFAVFQSMKDEPLKECIECQAPARRRIGPGAGFLFRGAGFYATEYRSQTYKDKAKSESGAAGGSEAGTAKGTDSAAGSEAGASTAKESAKPASDKPAAPKKPPES